MVSLPGIPSSSRITGPTGYNLNNTSASHPYETESVLGRGAYGTVYKGTDRNNPERSVALKEIRIQLNTDEGMPVNALREIALLKQLEKYNHRNVVRLFDVCLGSRSHREMKLMLVFEHIDQDLSQFLERCPSPGLGPDLIRHIFHEILSGVDYIHMHRIIHRDLKPQNILIGAGGRQVKLADFGLARVYGYQMALTSVVVTLYYRAPEVLLQDEYSLPIDLWSCGCILAELYNRRPLFKGSSELEQLCKIFEYIGTPDESQWPERISLPRSSFRRFTRQPITNLVPDLELEAVDLIEKLLMFNPHDRLSALQALQHAFVKDSLMHSPDDTAVTKHKPDDEPLALPLPDDDDDDYDEFCSEGGTALGQQQQQYDISSWPSQECRDTSLSSENPAVGGATAGGGAAEGMTELPCLETLEEELEESPRSFYQTDNLDLLASAAADMETYRDDLFD